MQLLGMGSEDAKAALQRAYELLDDVPQHPAREPLLFRLGFMLCLRAEYADALALAERIEALAQKADDPALLIAACTIQGEIQFLRGHPRIARQWLERGLAASDSLADADGGDLHRRSARDVARSACDPAAAPRADRAGARVPQRGAHACT